jgi:hypothetical protein
MESMLRMCRVQTKRFSTCEEPDMTERPTWITCRHIMDGSAKSATIRADGLCACEKCKEQVNLMETDQVHIVEEDRLIGILDDIKTVHGIENIKGKE